MTKKLVNPPTLFPSVQFGFSHAVVASGARTVFISGQTAWDANRNLVGTTLAEQTRQALRNVVTAVTAAGGTQDDIAALRIYIVESAKASLGEVGPALKEMFGSEPPASTWIGISFLAVPQFLVEIEAVARLE